MVGEGMALTLGVLVGIGSHLLWDERMKTGRIATNEYMPPDMVSLSEEIKSTYLPYQ
jgi:hypothetical protein